jgi:hypothetical protein
LSSLWLIAVRMPFVLQALQVKHRKENWNKPIRNPDKPSRRSNEGGSGTPLAVTLQPLVWGEDYPSGPERGNYARNRLPRQRGLNFVLRRVFGSPSIFAWQKMKTMFMTSLVLRNH